MAQIMYRRKRGDAVNTVVLKVDVDIEAKELVNRVAAHMGLSKGQATERLLNSIPVDARGLPLWPDVDDFQDKEQLPIE